MINFKAVLFDFDGTLAHLTIDFARMRSLVMTELVDILGGDSPVLLRRDLPVMELIQAACAGQNSVIIDAIAKRTESVVSAYEVEAAAESSLFPYTKSLLGTLKEQGIKTGIVTRNCRAAVKKVFPDHGEFCNILVCRDDVAYEDLKPQPGQLLAALTDLDCNPGEAMMVGDHPMDIKAGTAAGCRTAGVLCGNASREQMHVASPDWLSDDTETLFKELGLYK